MVHNSVKVYFFQIISNQIKKKKQLHKQGDSKFSISLRNFINIKIPAFQSIKKLQIYIYYCFDQFVCVHYQLPSGLVVFVLIPTSFLLIYLTNELIFIYIYIRSLRHLTFYLDYKSNCILWCIFSCNLWSYLYHCLKNLIKKK